jgi:hypothetical protein
MAQFERPDLVPIRTQRVPQTIETPVTFAAVPGAYVRFAYSRSSDSMANQIEGQDYLCFKHNDQRLVFIVADGVGSSFCGNLASRILGDNLLDWLWSLDIAYLGSAAALSEAAASYLNRLQKQAQHEVEEYELPSSMSPLIRQALEAQRAYGSEAIFAACRIDHSSPMIPDGLISLFWMGDTRIYALDDEGRPLDLGGSYDNANRWSTARGVRGVLHAWMRPLKGVSRAAAFTDGLSAHDPALLEYPDAKLDREIHLGARLPTSDDVALVDVILRTALYEGYPDPELPDPNAERPHLEQVWNPTGASSYELRWSWPGKGNRVSYIIQEAASPALLDARTFNVAPGMTTWRPEQAQPPGHYYYRVRAVRRFGGLTPWSELRQAKVAYPVPPAPTLFPVEADKAAVLHWEAEGESLEYLVERASTDAFDDAAAVYEGRSTAWAIPTDQPGVYYFRARAISDGGPGPWSEAQQVEIRLPPPPTPSLAAVSYGYAHGEYELRWQPVPRATHYELEVRPAGDKEAEPGLIRLEETIHLVQSQPTGEYIYRVRACHGAACSAWSNEQLAIVAPVAPAEAPELALDGPGEDGVLTLRWTETPGADVYLVEEADEPSFDNARLHSPEGRELALARREPGAYHFRVCAVNAGGEGPWSSVMLVSVAPETPGWIEARLAGEQGRVRVTWGASGGRAVYCLEMSASMADETAFHEVYRGEETQFEAAFPANAGALRFRVRAESQQREAGLYSGWIASQPVRQGPPATVAMIEPPEVKDSGEIHLRWNPVENAAGYLLEVARDEAFTEMRGVSIDRPGAAFRPPSGGQYWFRVRARRAGEEMSEPGNIVWVQVSRPASPRLWPLEPVPVGQPYEINWTGIPGCAYYLLQESTGADFAAGATDSMRIFHPAQKMRLPGQPAGRRFYRIRAVDDHDQASRWSNVLEVEIRA